MSKQPAKALAAQGISANYGAISVFSDISIELYSGELVALLGPNGSGKTTLLHSLCGIHPEATGEIVVGEKPLSRLSRRETAQRISLVPQFTEVGFEITVEDAVGLGRYPWLGPIAPLQDRDRALIQQAVDSLNLAPLLSRTLDTLSGGERQRVHLARALAQDTKVLLLDEPVASLDLKYQQETYQRLRELAHQQGKAILVADHHLNLVAAVCDRVIVIWDGAIWAAGTPAEIITEEMIRTVFDAHMTVRRDEKGRPQCLWTF
jgi:iron complex transport system ATP-binding protein